MQIQIDTPVTQRAVGNKHLASSLRARLKNGYPPASTFAKLVDRMTDEEIVTDYIEHQSR